MADIIKMNENTWRIEDGGVRFFVLTGSEKALMIDTGMNAANARELAESLTSLPLILINTHADPDHISGNDGFDTFMMHPDEEGNYKAHGGNKVFTPVMDGEVIDLGGRTLKVIHIPGHTPGSIALLDEKERVLFSGDTVQDSNIFMFGEFRQIDRYIESLKKLEEMKESFDQIYPCHGTIPVKPEQIALLIEAAGQTEKKSAAPVPVNLFGKQIALYKFDCAGFLREE